MLEKLRQGFQGVRLISLARLYSLFEGFKIKNLGQDDSKFSFHKDQEGLLGSFVVSGETNLTRTKLFEVLTEVASLNPAWLAQKINSFRGLDEFERFLLAYKVALSNPEALAENIKKFNLKNESLRCLLASEIARRTPWHLKSHFDAFELQSSQSIKRVVKELILAYPSRDHSAVKQLLSEDDRFEVFCEVFEAFPQEAIRNLNLYEISRQENQLEILRRILQKQPHLIFETNYFDFLPPDSLAEIVNDPLFERSILRAEDLKKLDRLGRESVKSLCLKLTETRSAVIADYILETSILTDDDRVEIASKALKSEPQLLKRLLTGSKMLDCNNLYKLALEALEQHPFLIPEVISLLDDPSKEALALALAKNKPQEIVNYLAVFATLDENFKTQLALTLAQRCSHELVSRIKQLQLTDVSKMSVAEAIIARDHGLVLSNFDLFDIQDPALRAQLAFRLLSLVKGHVVFYIKNFRLEEHDRLRIVEELMKSEPQTVARFIDRFEISDHEIRVALAEKLIEKCVAVVAENFHSFQIKDPSKREELAAKILDLDIDSFINHVKNFNLSDEALVDFAFRLLEKKRPYDVPYILETETLLKLFLEKVAIQENLSVFGLEIALKETCMRLVRLFPELGLTASGILKRALKQSAAEHLADALELVLERDIYLVCSALCKYRLEIAPTSHAEEKLRFAIQNLCWFTRVSEIRGLSDYTAREIWKTLLSFARNFQPRDLNFFIDPCFVKKLDRKLALRLLSTLAVFKHIGAREALSRTYFVDPRNLPEIAAELNKQLRDIFTEVFGLGALEEHKVQEFLETWPDLLPLFSVVCRVPTERYRSALVEAVSKLVQDPTGAWRYLPDYSSDQLPFSRGQVEAWKQNPSQLFLVEASSSSKPTEEDLAKIENQVEGLRNLLKKLNFELQSEASIGSSVTLERFFGAQKTINEETIREALSLFFDFWHQAYSGLVLDRAALIDAYRVISWIVSEVGKANSRGEFSLPKNLFQSLQAVKRSLEGLIGIDDDLSIFYQVITDDPYLLFTVGSLVDGVPSCLHPISSSYPEALAAHLLDANMKLIVTFYSPLKKIGSRDLRLKLLTGEAECHLDPRNATLTVKHGQEEAVIDVTPVRRRILRLGWSLNDQNQEKLPRVLVEPPYSHSFGKPLDQMIEGQETELLGQFCSNLAPNSLSWHRIKIAATKNPGGVYSDTGRKLIFAEWTISRTSVPAEA